MTAAQRSPLPPSVDTFGCSRIGAGHDANTDQFIVAEVSRVVRVSHASDESLDDVNRQGHSQAHLLLVSDGVKDSRSAARASRLVIDEVIDSILNIVPWTPSLDVGAEADLRRTLEETVERANDEVQSTRPQEPVDPPEATMTLAFVRWPLAFIVHAGDTRAYRLRESKLKRLTRDHTVAQRMIDAGHLDPDDAAVAKFADTLWNAVGGDDAVTPDVTVERLQPGDSLLLCSDGLTGHLNDGAICRVVCSNASARAACEALLDTVAEIGGADDCTVALARFGDRGAVVADAPDAEAATDRARNLPTDEGRPGVADGDTSQPLPA